jgi:hypothetical protein
VRIVVAMLVLDLECFVDGEDFVLQVDAVLGGTALLPPPVGLLHDGSPQEMG